GCGRLAGEYAAVDIMPAGDQRAAPAALHRESGAEEPQQHFPAQTEGFGWRRPVIDLHDQEECSAAFGYTRDLRDGSLDVIDVIERVEARDDVEISVGIRDLVRRSLGILHFVPVGAQLEVFVRERVEADALGGALRPLQTSTRTTSNVQ